MKRELLLGAGLGVLAFLQYDGVDILPYLIFGAMAYAMLYVPSLRGLSRKFLANPTPVSRTPTTFTDIGGQSTAKKELVEALDFLNQAERIHVLGIRPLKGILLTGPPGTGKTLLAKAAAHYTDSVFIAAAGSEFIEMYAGVGAQRVREMFQKARESARREHKKSAILFVDEMEVLGGKRGQHMGHLEYDQTLNQLLVEMDGMTGDEDIRILVMGATNRADLLDDALMRPGRFDRVVRVDLPDREGRLQILEVHTRNKPLASDVDLGQIARETFGFSGAHLESLSNEAAILAFREGAEQVQDVHLREAIDKVMMGERLDRRPGSEEMRRIAIHETGHAIVSETRRPGSVATITITSRGQALGYVRQSPEDDRFLETRQQLLDDIAVALGGAIAEELVLGSRSTGAASDFQQAIAAARRMVLSGMSRAGIITEEILPKDQMHEAVTEIVVAVEEEIRSLLRERRRELEDIAAVLLERESMPGEFFRSVLGLEAVPVAM